jgi:hypothetical protein
VQELLTKAMVDDSARARRSGRRADSVSEGMRWSMLLGEPARALCSSVRALRKLDLTGGMETGQGANALTVTAPSLALSSRCQTTGAAGRTEVCR